MTKEENILSNDLIEDDLLIKKDKLNILLETNEQDLTKNNSYEDKEENKGKKEDKRKFEKGYASKKNFILKSDFYNKKKVSDGKYQNINNIRFTSIINNYYNDNFIPKSIEVCNMISINPNTFGIMFFYFVFLFYYLKI